jgi:hypothetical protein
MASLPARAGAEAIVAHPREAALNSDKIFLSLITRPLLKLMNGFLYPEAGEQTILLTIYLFTGRLTSTVIIHTSSSSKICDTTGGYADAAREHFPVLKTSRYG